MPDERHAADAASDDAPVVPARRGMDDEPKRRRPWVRVLLIVLGALLTLGVAVAIFYAVSIDRALGGVTRNSTMMPSASTRPEDDTSAGPEGPLTFVLMGTDAEEGGAARSDSLMVAYLPADRQHLYLVSFTRDMWVTIPGHGKAKINAAYSLGGPALTIQTLESLLNVRMDHAAQIDFDGFIYLTTVLGGVTVYNEHASSTAGFTFPVGWITISGEQALVYCRERKTLPNGDLDRAKRQRDVVSAIVDKLTSPSVIANPITLNKLVGEVAHVVTVDDGLTNSVVYGLARQLKFGSGAIRSLQAPILGFGTSTDGQSINIVDEAGVAQLAEAMRSDTMEAYYEAHKDG